MIRIALYDSAQDNVPRAADLTWPELAAKLTTHRRSDCATLPCPGGRCPAKNGPAWSPADIVERRRTENVRAITVAVFDLDHLNEQQLSCVDNVEQLGFAYAVHSTHSNRPPLDYCLRLAIPLSRPVLPREWPQVRAAAIKLLQIPADPATKDLARLYYLPDSPVGVEPLAASGEGRPLDVDELLALARAGTLTPTAVAPIIQRNTEVQQAAAEGPVDLYQLRAMLRRVRKAEHVAIIRRALAGEPLAERGAQDDTLNSLMSVCAFVLPLATPEDAILELFADCFRKTDWGEGSEHLREQARIKLQRHRERRAERDAERKAANDLAWQQLGRRKAPEPDPDEPLQPGAEEDEPDPDAWVNELVFDETRTGERRIRNCEANVYTVLYRAPEWRNVIRFNEASKRLEVEGGPLPPNLDPESLEVEIANWIQRSEYGELGLRPKPQVVGQQILAVAKRNSYDPVRDYLDGLVWDGTARLDGWLGKYLGAQGDADHLAAIGAKFAISCVARALRPGCKVDTVLILEGVQGLRKSSAFRELGGAWFSDAPIDVHNKDSAMLASQFWLIELAELSTFRKAESESLKAFISRSEDTYRPPYGRTNVKALRRCVFVGTTNDDAYLRDPTGHRRYWPVSCTAIDLAGLRRDRDQLWAEAVVRFHRDEPWWLDGEQAKRAEAQAALRTEGSGDGRQEAILRWFLKMPPEKRPREVTVLQVAEHALTMPIAQVDQRTATEVGTALSALGFTKHQRRAAGGRRPRVYVPPEDLLQAARDESEGLRRSSLAVIAGSKAT